MMSVNEDELDRQDMIRLAQGHDDALNALMERHGEKVFHYLIRWLQHEDEAADLTQETFVRVFQNRTRFNPQQKFKTWLYSIASNLARDRFRWRTRHPQVSLNVKNEETGAELGDLIAEDRLSPSEDLAAAERTETIRKAIAALPEDLRVPLILSEYEDLAHQEIGEILECTAKAVETRIYRARKLLRESLANMVRAYL